MNLDKRLRLLEAKVEFKKPGCNPTLFIVVAEKIQSGQPLDCVSYGRLMMK